ncbi:hypothetical protein AURDEDRAFT_161502 [Auricularia subglabra TFB-10046 SS5]|nr:hypothetical protein AURDEDRAFT_161502 [Auricularia subglabra TFB-10046 SS5]
MSEHFLDILLPDVLDFLDLESLLLSAMPVSRYWREQAVGHRTYWRSITLAGRALPGATSPRHALSADLFFLRLSRTHARPIELTVIWDPPDAVFPVIPTHAVLTVIATHLAHVRCLTLSADAQRWGGICMILQRPAPMLESLTLSCEPSPTFSITTDQSLFSGRAPALREVALTNIHLPAAPALPACFRRIVILKYESMGQPLPLPNLFPHFQQLKQLDLVGPIIPGDSALLRAETWSALPVLGLFGRKTVERWLNLGAVLAKVRSIFLSLCGTSGVGSLVKMLGTRLTVEFPRAWLNASGFFVSFSAYGESKPRQCVVQMPLPILVHPPQRHAIMAFQDAFVSDRIVELVLALEHWDDLIGDGYLTRFSALQRLVLTITLFEAKWPPSPAAHMACPRLETLALRRSAHAPGKQPAVDAADVVAFAKSALGDGAPLPLVLELNAVVLQGGIDGAKDIFSRCVVGEGRI